MVWADAPLEAVGRNMASTGYPPPDRITYVPGLVEETCPGTVPEVIAMRLRLPHRRAGPAGAEPEARD